MAAAIEYCFDLLLVANGTGILLLVGHLVVHHPLAVSLSFLPPALVHVTRLRVFPLALTIGKIVHPLASVDITVGILHRTFALFHARHKVSHVRFVIHADVMARSVWTAALQGHVEVVGSKE